MSKQRGFTLIELMIVVVIVAILASIALPAYNDYITRSRLSEARALLEAQRLRMEQWFQDNRTYVGGCASFTAPDNWDPVCATPTAATYLLTLSGASGTMALFTYTVNQANIRATTQVAPGWTGSADCWIARRDGSC